MNSDCDEQLFFPSEVVNIDIEGSTGKYKIKIPKREVPTVKDIFENNEYAVQGPRLRSGPMKVVDIGANIGLFSIYMKFQDPDCTIDCFEPSPSTLALLQSNTGHIPGITIHPYGLYNKDDEVDFFINGYNTGENSIRQSTKHFAHSVKVNLKNAASEFERLGIGEIDVLKIDTEGCEVEIIESLSQRLTKASYIILEYHSEKDRKEIDRLLTDFHLMASSSVRIGGGLVKYMNSDLLKEYDIEDRGPPENHFISLDSIKNTIP